MTRSVRQCTQPSLHFQFQPLSPAIFSGLFGADDASLQAVGAVRVVADGRPAFPCRVSLVDAAAGESLLLLPYAHQTADSPFRASGPIYVREDALVAAAAQPAVDEVPALFAHRLLSLRGYDARGWICRAEVVEGVALGEGLRSLLAQPEVDAIHVHFARPGCFACRVERCQ